MRRMWAVGWVRDGGSPGAGSTGQGWHSGLFDDKEVKRYPNLSFCKEPSFMG